MTSMTSFPLIGSNQSQTLIKTYTKDHIDQPTLFNAPHISNPFIDRLSVTLIFPTEYREEILLKAMKALKNKGIFQSGPRSSNYRQSRFIACSGSVERVVFQTDSRSGDVPDCRFEFNPSKLGVSGFLGLNSMLLEIFPEGWDFVAQRGRVSRVDVAVDISGAQMEHFLFLPQQALSGFAWRRNGRLQTIYLGRPRSNQFRIYDKTAEQKAKGVNLGANVIRIEKVLRNPKTSLCDLAKLPNPFAALKLISALPALPQNEKLEPWLGFTDSVQVRGLVAALALQPVARGTRYRKILKSSEANWWAPESIWKGWYQACELLI